MRAWSFLAISGKRQYAGNDGYDDAVSSVYRFDSTVGNSRHVKRGDLALLRDRHGLLGIGLISSLHKQEGASKQRNRCPVCGIAAIKKRAGMTPAYRCHSGHEFDAPKFEIIFVTTYEADYGESWIPLPGILNADALASVSRTKGAQNSIREIDGVALAHLISAGHPQTHSVLSAFLQKLSPETLDEGPKQDVAMPDHYVPSLEDTRVQILRSIKARRGQGKFRKGLVLRYGPSCMVSGCDVIQIVEAAHIWPYKGASDNAPSNGLLLRADIHTLFDLDRIGIEPETLAVSVSSTLMGSEYASFHGIKLKCSSSPNANAMRLRWKCFLEKQNAH